MLTRKSLLVVTVVLASIMLFTTPEIKAHFPNGVPVALPAPLSCITLPGENWQVDAVTGVPNGEFPVSVSCTSPEHGGKQCAEYRYTVTSLWGKNSDHVVFAVSADQDLDSAGPSASVQPPGPGDSATGFLKNTRHEYPVRVNPTPQVPASMVIVGPTSARITTVLIRSGTKIVESCLIAGPGTPLDEFKPKTTVQNVLCAGGKCNCIVQFDVTGNPISVTTDTPECAVGQAIEEPLLINGAPAKHFDTITSGDGTCTWYNTKPFPTCVCSSAGEVCR